MNEKEQFLEHCEKGDLGKVAEMLKNDSDLLFAVNKARCRALHIAAINGDLELLELLISDGNFFGDFPNESGLTALHYAALFNHENIVKRLLQKLVDVNRYCIGITAMQRTKLDVNRNDYKGRTALHYAAWNGSIPTIIALIQKGAEIDVEDKKGVTPLDCALSTKQYAAAYYLWCNSTLSTTSTEKSGVANKSFNLEEVMKFLKSKNNGKKV